MTLLKIVSSGLAAWVFGFAWYILWSKPWAASAGARPVPKTNSGILRPFLLSALALMIAAAGLYYLFDRAVIVTVVEGSLFGLGIGAVLILPWIAITHLYPGRPAVLTLIDGGYVVGGCGIIGAMLTTF